MLYELSYAEYLEVENMSEFFSSFKAILLSYKNFFRGAGSVIELFPIDYHSKPLSKKYHFTNYISDRKFSIDLH